MNKDNAKDYLPFVQALADGKNIQMSDSAIRWTTIFDATFEAHVSRYRIKPELEYPVTSLTDDELFGIYAPEETQYRGFVALANAATKKAILDGDVILPEKK